jgi:hypothetical protein
MEELLKKYHFIKKTNNTWIRNNWVVRIYDEIIEVYEDIIDKDHNRYYSGDVSTLDLETLLEELD